MPSPTPTWRLVKRHPLTSIRSENDLDAAQAVIDDLLREELDDGKQAYLDALSDLMIVYEQEHHSVAPLPPHELLAQMLEEPRHVASGAGADSRSRQGHCE